MFGPLNLFVRWLFTTFVVFGTFNPSGVSFYHWATGDSPVLSLVGVVGVALLAIYVFLLRSTWRSIRLPGIVIGVAFFALFNLMLVDLEIVALNGRGVLSVMILASAATLLSIGLSFSAIRARLSGFIDTDFHARYIVVGDYKRFAAKVPAR